MKKFWLFLIIITISIFLFSGCNRKDENLQTYLILNSNWELKQTDSLEWHQAVVPGNIYSDLYYDTLIENPLYRNNAEQLKWVSEKKWEYRNIFTAGIKFLKNENIFLILEGIDTYADIYLNDSLILSTDNMFLKWQVDCKEFLKFGENELIIKFDLKKDEFSTVSDSTLLPFRKSAIQYGLNSAPELISCGIWKPTYFVGFEKFFVEKIESEQISLTDSLAKIKLCYQVNSSKSTEITINTTISDSIIFSEKFELQKGENVIYQEISIQNPKLWYPNGYGEQNLYNLNFDFYYKDKTVESKQLTIGLRTAVIEKDEEGNLKNIKINGQNIFIKGANYNTPLIFGNNINAATTENLINYAEKSNLNLLKVSGSGIYESDEFYNLCDKAGIIVIQEIPVIYSEISNEEKFKSQLKDELKQNISRLKNHPSLIFWYFNSQSENPENEEISMFFDEIISSSSNGFIYLPINNKKNSIEKYPFGKYEKYNNFIFEIGMQSLPMQKNIANFTESGDLNFNSEVLEYLSFSNTSLSDFTKLISENYKVPLKFENISLLNQYIQSEKISNYIKTCRIADKEFSGVIYSDFNEFCPSISYSGIDYFGNWKPLQYAIKKAFDKYQIVVSEEGNSIKINIISDNSLNEDVDVVLKVSDFYGKSIWKQRETINLKANSTDNKLTFTKSKITRNKPLNALVIKIKVVKESETLTETFYYFVSNKDLELIKPNITTDILKIDNGYAIEFKTDYLAKNVCISSIVQGFFEDNYFDLLPGESKFVKFETTTEIADFKVNFVFSTLYDIINE